MVVVKVVVVVVVVEVVMLDFFLYSVCIWVDEDKIDGDLVSIDGRQARSEISSPLTADGDEISIDLVFVD
ncbi:hypothetical protein ACOSQ4_003868 [Xanthoceras sorbifolium]